MLGHVARRLLAGILTPSAVLGERLANKPLKTDGRTSS
jgi:hypothetical protein